MLPYLTTTMFSTTYTSGYRTFTLAQPFTVKHGHAILNSSATQFAIVMAANGKKVLSFVGFSQFKDNAKKAKGTF